MYKKKIAKGWLEKTEKGHLLIANHKAFLSFVLASLGRPFSRLDFTLFLLKGFLQIKFSFA